MRTDKAVLLMHCDEAGERFVVVGIRVLRVHESEDVRGLSKLDSTEWEPYEAEHRPSLPPLKTPDGKSRTTHPVAEKRERQRQATWASRRAAELEATPDPAKVREATRVARFGELTSWSDCPVPLTGVYTRDLFADGHETDWLLVATSPSWTARRVRDLYGLRTDIE